MRAWISILVACLVLGVLLDSRPALAADPSDAPQEASKKEAHAIDLPTALRLAGAQNLDIDIARKKLDEARANHLSALEQFLPSASPGFTYRRHDNNLQDTEGNILDVHKQSYAAGGTFSAQVDLGNALYAALETHRLEKAAGHALGAKREETILAAAEGYFDLVKAQALVRSAREAVRVAGEYEGQLGRAVTIGIAFKGDQLRARVQRQKEEIGLRRSEEEQRVAAARLSETLRLDSTVELVAQDADLVPVALVRADEPEAGLVQRALASRPELKRSQALVEAAKQARRGAVFGPLIPTAGAQAFAGGLGGGKHASTGSFGESEDYQATVSWRIGPGGLFDLGRIRATRAREESARLEGEKATAEITREVVEELTRVRSLGDRMATAKRSLRDAEETLRLTRARKEFGVGSVLEDIQSQQDLARAREEYVSLVAEYDKAQYALGRTIGLLPSVAP